MAAFERANGIPEPWDDVQTCPIGVNTPSCGFIAGDPNRDTNVPVANVLLEGAGVLQTGDRTAKQGEPFLLQLRKTPLCRYFIGGCCWNGGACRFAHINYELQGGPDLTKTIMCTAWLAGSCPLEARDCPYAHGSKELRGTPLYFKTAICNFMAGTCTAGDSCRFAHEAHELKKTTETEAPQAPQFASNLEEASTKGTQVCAVATSETSLATSGFSVMGDWVDRRSPDSWAHRPTIRYATFSSSIHAPMFSNFGDSWKGS